MQPKYLLKKAPSAANTKNDNKQNASIIKYWASLNQKNN